MKQRLFSPILPKQNQSHFLALTIFAWTFDLSINLKRVFTCVSQAPGCVLTPSRSSSLHFLK